MFVLICVPAVTGTALGQMAGAALFMGDKTRAPPLGYDRPCRRRFGMEDFAPGDRIHVCVLFALKSGLSRGALRPGGSRPSIVSQIWPQLDGNLQIQEELPERRKKFAAA
jgi:hypothetical protein